MKLLRYGNPGQERPGIVDAQGQVRDLSALVADIGGAALSAESLQTIANTSIDSLPLVDRAVRLGPCVSSVGKFICIGLNYADHAAESGMPVPAEPVVFMKATSAITGPNDPIIKPRNSTKLDWEVELGIVIGKHASYVELDEAMDYIAGYCVINDVSERNFQLERGGQWDKGKGCDSFGPIGPYLVTKDEVADPLNLQLWLKVNGKTFQDGSTKHMVFGPAFLVHYLSQFMSLQPGDVISTGTPPGVGLGQNPPVYLHEGDVVELGIEGMGIQKQIVVNAQ
ncbi:fumarylacetoacetate hydrolase family protein [Cellvibrio japonicus]|uniref:Putative fumarylacetoacetate hydrolase family protein n=1 Tax=Cellvibrio japonicus (strain Ueda107) TaxID=498211 RepID=B3PBS5_CELJU|nr:fumarylacetoacetate hydrolase family protein [Cellvibrio japonicus]ACE86105.1 putative fumarylacetoacetate hydrolase family protein [Cellvibrio japonicus Ueda107]QEI11743.1 fumarylacetoacetate hydrolase family protein [Cellvibrio japonicus]QEI15317.1 fumarylacetoacetate hydrolase family protein [Cellvibrio japonicus]QEI18897.1 fumarylacetoacetate hydrolase family protein [Cellvibrio japonicus]